MAGLRAIAAYFAGACLLASVAGGATIIVELQGGGDFTSIQAAIDAAKSGDTVLVKPGEYEIEEPINFNRLHDPEDPWSPPVKDLVLKSTQGAEVTTIATRQTVTVPPGHWAVVAFASGETSASVLEGFTITRVRQHDPPAGQLLDGVRCDGSSATIRACRIMGMNGNGVSCTLAPVLMLTDCTIAQNDAGIRSFDSSATIERCEIRDNAQIGLDSQGESIILRDSRVIGNGNMQCAGIWIHHKTNFVEITDCLVAGNGISKWAEDLGKAEAGGALWLACDNATLTGCRILGNYSRCRPAALFVFDSTQVTVLNSIIAGNRTRNAGEVCFGKGHIICSYGSLTMVNCTIAGNDGHSGGLITAAQIPPAPVGTVSLENCIVWGNTPNTASGIGAGCLTNRDPMFVNPGVFVLDRFKTVTMGGTDLWLPDFILEEPDYHLQPGSPAIDAGESVGAPETDMDGNPRSCGAGVDIGAYEDCGGVRFRRGDVDASGGINITDPIALLGHLFQGGTAPGCLDAADADDSGDLQITDAIYLLSHLFRGGPPPEEPFGECGVEARTDDLGCESFAPCTR